MNPIYFFISGKIHNEIDQNLTEEQYQNQEDEAIIANKKPVNNQGIDEYQTIEDNQININELNNINEADKLEDSQYIYNNQSQVESQGIDKQKTSVKNPNINNENEGSQGLNEEQNQVNDQDDDKDKTIDEIQLDNNEDDNIEETNNSILNGLNMSDKMEKQNVADGNVATSDNADEIKDSSSEEGESDKIHNASSESVAGIGNNDIKESSSSETQFNQNNIGDGEIENYEKNLNDDSEQINNNNNKKNEDITNDVESENIFDIENKVNENEVKGDGNDEYSGNADGNIDEDSFNQDTSHDKYLDNNGSIENRKPQKDESKIPKNEKKVGETKNKELDELEREKEKSGVADKEDNYEDGSGSGSGSGDDETSYNGYGDNYATIKGGNI